MIKSSIKPEGLYGIWSRDQPDLYLHRHPKMVSYLLTGLNDHISSRFFMWGRIMWTGLNDHISSFFKRVRILWTGLNDNKNVFKKKGDYAEKVWPFPYACYIYVQDIIWRLRSGSCKKHQQDMHVCETQMPTIVANSNYGQDHKDIGQGQRTRSQYLDTKDLVSRNAHVQYESCSLYYFVWMLIIPHANEVWGWVGVILVFIY